MSASRPSHSHSIPVHNAGAAPSALSPVDTNLERSAHIPGKVQVIRRNGQVTQFEQARGLAKLFVVELGGLLVELRGRVDLRHRMGLISVGAGTEQLPMVKSPSLTPARSWLP